METRIARAYPFGDVYFFNDFFLPRMSCVIFALPRKVILCGDHLMKKLLAAAVVVAMTVVLSGISGRAAAEAAQSPAVALAQTVKAEASPVRYYRVYRRYRVYRYRHYHHWKRCSRWRYIGHGHVRRWCRYY
jgi:hypothetical protein